MPTTDAENEAILNDFLARYAGGPPAAVEEMPVGPVDGGPCEEGDGK
jgi:hypothetical protein